MWISKTSAYAIRVAIHLAMQPEGGPVSVRQVAQSLGLSFTFLNKICQQMVRAGILSASRGAKGGVRLVRPPAEVSLLDIVEGLDSRLPFAQCLLGLDDCGRAPACAVHQPWQSIQRQLRDLLEQTDLELLSRRVRQEGLRLRNEPPRQPRRSLRSGQIQPQKTTHSDRREGDTDASSVSEGGADGR